MEKAQECCCTATATARQRLAAPTSLASSQAGTSPADATHEPTQPQARPVASPTFTNLRLYLILFMARPLGCFFLSCFWTLGVWPLTCGQPSPGSGHSVDFSDGKQGLLDREDGELHTPSRRVLKTRVPDDNKHTKVSHQKPDSWGHAVHLQGRRQASLAHESDIRHAW